MTQILAYAAALLIGLSLGLVGSGGAVLTVPILTYGFGIPPTLATGYSLGIVGITSLFGVYRNLIRKQLNLKIALPFAIPTLIGVISTRNLILPRIPNVIMTFRGLSFSKDMFIMTLLATLLLVSAFNMIQDRPGKPLPANRKLNLFQACSMGLGIGILAGITGIGGGFIIIPALVGLIKLDMKEAVATSLTIVALNSSIGFLTDFHMHEAIDWQLFLTITAIAVAGIILGMRFGKHIPSEKLKPGFGWFILVAGVYIFARELAGLTD